MPQIKDLQAVHRVDVVHFIAGQLANLRAAGYQVPPVPAGSDFADVAIEARIDHGRWIADCPFCPGAELVDLADLRFFCLSCYNEQAASSWLHVVLPADEHREAIVTALQDRPQHLQEWDSRLTAGDLLLQNVALE